MILLGIAKGGSEILIVSDLLTAVCVFLLPSASCAMFSTIVSDALPTLYLYGDQWISVYFRESLNREFCLMASSSDPS